MPRGGWRRAFCTSVRRDPEVTVATRMEVGEKQQRTPSVSPGPSPRSCAKRGFFSGSNPSTPRLALAAGLRCQTKSKSPDYPNLQCDTPTSAVSATAAAAATANSTPRSRSPALFRRKAFSTPSSPRSPSRFALFKHLSRSRCRLCSQILKASQETPVFTAECSHAFHFPCIAAHVRGHGSLACPVCSAAWRQAPFLSALHRREEDAAAIEQGTARETENRNPNRRTTSGGGRNASKGGERQLGENRMAAVAKVYDDDEPLLLVPKPNQGGGVRFNPIPEATNEDKDEDEYGEGEDEFHGLLATPRSRSPGLRADGGVPCRPTPRSTASGVQVSVMPQAALLSEGRRHRNYVVALKVKAPPIRSSAPLLDPAPGRAPIDLVTVLDVSQGMTGEKLQMLKRAIRLVVSSLGPADRLSMVAFSASAGAKRLLPLRQMSKQGQRAARQIVERLVVVGGAAKAGGASVGDALRKATKVLEDRRERNPVATIMLLSDGRQPQQTSDPEKKDNNNNNNCDHHDHKPLRSPRGTGGGDIRRHALSTTTTAAATTRFAHLEIPVEDAGFVGAAEPSPMKQEDAFIKCVGGLVSVVMQDVRLQLEFPSGEISAVYPCGGGSGCGDVAIGGENSVLWLGDLYAEEEREVLVELRAPVAATGPQSGHHHLSVKCNYRDPATQELAFGAEQILILPLLQYDREPGSSCRSTTALRLRNIFVATRAVAESRRLGDLSDFATAHHLLSSARALLLQSASDAHGHHLVQNLDAELADLQRRRRCLTQHQLHHDEQQEEHLSPSGRTSRREGPAEVRGEPLTPTSAWRAAEQLAKVAIMRKSLSRVSDLHGFENARF
ncbi:E3 ubiquitin-protein ligase WAV3-like [Musa acuminata AAA Group]|uniref:E3 ubiquitin-protein ligase WAV3-like n=1 Tax=Musa acuminata AAA Group TaxID=214697 RepID=UPI0031D385D2